ncbi:MULTISPECIES: hypothetical protein [Dietzia]|uniref:hypothetical protein n=1 Tax=Dietzia TaxID=37914 RepID=UPI00223A9AB4|nr:MULTISPECIES: hypothetical protein [Dietzia]MCT1713234.1 hypothetical protein [Dietzia cinnamea]MCT2140834.1 hypothetical protein [Dietzia cinnamea]MCT2173088.1 hypothetical protein [Dietzia cinnamea]MCT2273066.1 hypothetical protein [Dietzia cinnamea]
MIFRPNGPISGPMYDAINAAFGAIARGLEAVGIPFDQSAVPLSFLAMPFVAGSSYLPAAVGS